MERALRETLPQRRFTGVSPARSQAMRAIRGGNNRSTEVPLRMAFVRAGLSGWKADSSVIVGHPDFCFIRHKLAIFVDGCFWHGCPDCGHIPRTNRRFWSTKVRLNKQRDRRTNKALRALGYQVVRLWEHEVVRDVDGCVKKLRKRLKDIGRERFGAGHLRLSTEPFSEHPSLESDADFA
jgi:DNA mismatch endonuclease Vsr